MTDENIAKAKKTLFKRAKVDAPEAEPLEEQPTWSKHRELICPIGKTYIFARIPEIKMRGQVLLPEGKVYLRYGEHFGPNNGFGFQHIWREHFYHEKDHDVAMVKVRNEVAKVLRPNTPIYYQKEGERALVHRVHVGMVVLELFQGAAAHYSVITGGFNPQNTKGSLVGALV